MTQDAKSDTGESPGTDDSEDRTKISASYEKNEFSFFIIIIMAGVGGSVCITNGISLKLQFPPCDEQ